MKKKYTTFIKLQAYILIFLYLSVCLPYFFVNKPKRYGKDNYIDRVDASVLSRLFLSQVESELA